MGVARALRVAASSSQHPYLNSSLPANLNTFTFSARVRFNEITSTRTIFYSENSGATDKLTLVASGDPWVIWRDEAYTDAHLADYDPAANTWHWVACRIDTGASPTAKLWIAPDGGSITTATGSPTGLSTPIIFLFIAYNSTAQSDISEIKMWTSALTDGEVEAERDYVVPQKDGAWAWYGMDSDTLATCLADNSGNGHTLLVASNPTVITGAGTTWDVGGSASPGSITTTITL